MAVVVVVWAATWVAGVAGTCGVVMAWRWPVAGWAAGTQPIGIMRRSSIIGRSSITHGSSIGITVSFSSEDQSSRSDTAPTAGDGWRPRGDYAASGFAVTITEPLPLRGVRSS